MLTGALGLNQDSIQSNYISNEAQNQDDIEDSTLSISQVESVFRDLSTIIEEEQVEDSVEKKSEM